MGTSDKDGALGGDALGDDFAIAVDDVDGGTSILLDEVTDRCVTVWSNQGKLLQP